MDEAKIACFPGDIHVATRRRIVLLRRGLQWLALAAVIGIVSALPLTARAQSPELSMREFASSQIKKGVRSIGFGGDGATWGNYGLVWKDAGTALADYGETQYAGGNDFHFVAAGATTPSLWHDLAIYAIGLGQDTNDVHFNAKSPGLGPAPVALQGHGSDHAFFSKIAMPLGGGVSAGVLLSYETSFFDAASVANPAQHVHYETEWRPSGGFGVAWQPTQIVLVGFRALFNNDRERRTDSSGVSIGNAHTIEYRLGGSVSPWEGALIDIGGTRLEKRNSLAGSHTVALHPNLGVEQALLSRHLTLRAGLDETSPTAGMSIKFAPVNVDLAYVRDMAHARVGDLFGRSSNSVVMTLTVDYRGFLPGS
jgi:hypothetical protein